MTDLRRRQLERDPSQRQALIRLLEREQDQEALCELGWHEWGSGFVAAGAYAARVGNWRPHVHCLACSHVAPAPLIQPCWPGPATARNVDASVAHWASMVSEQAYESTYRRFVERLSHGDVT